MKSYWKKGDHNGLCDVCGFVFKSSDLKERWDGLRVCEEDWELRHPLDFIRAVKDDSSVPWTSPDDSESVVVTYTTNQSPSATVYPEPLYFNTTSGNLSCTLPAANDSSFKGISVTFIISNVTGSNSVTIASASVIIGNVTVSSGTSARIRNIPTDNLWIRDS